MTNWERTPVKDVLKDPLAPRAKNAADEDFGGTVLYSGRKYPMGVVCRGQFSKK